MAISNLLLACLAALAPVVTASPPQRRQAAATNSVTVTAESVVTATTTVTRSVHPSDVTSTYFLGYDVAYPFTTTLWRLDTCISYSYTGYELKPSQVSTNPTILPETTRRPSTSTVLVTVTRTRTTTVESEVRVTVTNRAPTTSVVIGVETSSASTGLTVRSNVCTNTGIISAYLRQAETCTSTSGQTYTRVQVTQPCPTTNIISRTVPGLDVKQIVTRQVPLYERFTDGTTVATSVQPSEYYTTVIISAATATITDVVCNNPTFVTTSVYYTTTSTRWSTATVTSCPKAGLADRDVNAPKIEAEGAASEQGTYTTVVGLDNDVAVAKALAASTVEFTTVVLLSPTIVHTYTGTGIQQVVTPTLTTVVMRGETITQDATRTVTACPQTPAAKL